MENDQLAWAASPTSPNGVSGTLRKQEGPVRLGLVLLVGSEDATSCCAQNFERTVFRDRKVVAVAERYFQAFRFYKSDAGAWYQSHDLDKSRPALLVLDHDGALLASHQQCVNPGDFLGVLKAALKLSGRKQAYQRKAVKLLDHAEEVLAEADYPATLSALGKIQDELLMSAERHRFDLCHQEIAAAADEAVAAARKLEQAGELEAAFTAYDAAYRTFSRLEAYRELIGERLKELKKRL